MEKQDLRTWIRQQTRQFSQQQLAELSTVIMERLLHHPQMQTAKTVLMYYALPDEVDTHAAIDTLVTMGKEVFLPAVVDAEHFILRHYTGKKDLTKGAYGIMESIGKVANAAQHIDVAVVPGMAFDTDGHRLGRGKGYYDRFLAHQQQTYKIGICFDFQKVSKVCTTENDIKMDEVL